IGAALRDDLAPPSSVLAAANVITAPKEVVILPKSGHQDEQGSQASYNQRCFGAWLPALREGQAVPPLAASSTAPAQSTSGPADQPAARTDDPVWVERHAELLEKA